MRLIANSTPGLVIRAYDARSVTVQYVTPTTQSLTEETFETPVLLQAEGVTTLTILQADDLSDSICQPIWDRSPELVILGHDQADLGLSAQQRAMFLSRGIGLEVMRLGAACRTYNLLSADGRAVIALLFPG
jgi:uncharacterized protein